MSVTKERTCRDSSKRIRRSMGPAQRQAMRINGGSMPNCDASGSCAFAFGWFDRGQQQLHLSRAAGFVVAAVDGKPLVSGFVLVVEEPGLRLVAEHGGIGAHAGRGRKRLGAESVRSSRRAWAIAVRCNKSICIQRNVRAAGLARGPAAGALLVNGWQLNTIVSLASGTPFTVYDSDNAPMQGGRRRSRASTRAGRTCCRIRTRGRIRRTSGSAAANFRN